MTLKLLALLDGRPILAHVLGAAADFSPAATVVVLSDGLTADELEAGIEWRGERRVHNPHPERGLAGSVRIGLEALADATDPSVRSTLILLGDQPKVRTEVMRKLLDAAGSQPDRLFVVPRYGAGGGGNPLLIRREAWSLATELEGDRGFGPLLRARPDMVRTVAVSGANPDIDTPADLASLSRVPAPGRSDRRAGAGRCRP